MALRYVNGFEDLSDLVIEGGAPTVATGRNGNGLHCTTSSDAASYRVPTAFLSSTITIGFAMKPYGFGAMSANPLITFYDETFVNEQLRICIGGSGQIAVYRTTTQLGLSAAGVLSSGVWQYVEVQIFCADAGGTATVRVNGTTVVTVTGADTKASTSSSNLASIKFGANIVASPITMDYDDLYVMTGTGDSFQGDCRVETLYPNGDGSGNSWTNNAGNSTSNWSYVDEVPVDTSDYVASSTTGQQDLYTLTDLVSTAQAVLAVQPTAYVAKTDGTTRSVKLLTRRTAITGQPAHALDNLSAFTVYDLLTTDPDTGVAWTPTNVNALQAGVEAA